MTSSIPTDSNPLPLNPSSFRVVPLKTPATPPTKVPPQVEATADVTANPTTVSPVPLANPSLRRWLIGGAIVFGIGGLGLIPVPVSVTGNAEISSTPEARQTVTMPLSGRVKEVLVRSNQVVKPNQPMAILTSEELNSELAQAVKDYEAANSEVALTGQQLGTVQASVREAEAQVSTQRQKVQFLQQQLDGLKLGMATPEIRQLRSESSGLESEIVGLESELGMVNVRIARYSGVVKAGAIPLNELEELQRVRETLTRQIREKSHQREALTAQVDGVTQNLEQELLQRRGEELQAMGAVDRAQAQVEAVVKNESTRKAMALKLKGEVERLKRRQGELVLLSKISGTVVTEDLDRLQNQYLQAGSEVLSVVDLGQLTTTVRVSPEDAPLVKAGAKVKFRPQGTGLRDYSGTVEAVKIEPVVSKLGEQLPPTVTVRVSLKGGDGLLRPGLRGYAHVEAGRMRLYQKAGREFLKLVPLGKFF